jgi:hypothetical protein
MIIGVITFSIASGSLASILQNVDCKNAKFQEKLQVLNRLNRDYGLPRDLFSRLKRSLEYTYGKDIQDKNNFLQELPH